MRRSALGYLFIAPWVIGFLTFTVGPFLASIYLSFTAYDILTPPRWVGVANYRTLIHDDPLFLQSVWVTIRYSIVAVPLGTVAAISLALLLNLEVRGIAFFRAVFYLPSIVPAVATSMIFIWLLNPATGFVNRLLATVGLPEPPWLSNPSWAPWTLVLLGLWGVGGSTVIYLAGLKDVPSELYEAALLDGAGPFARMRRITLPMLTPVIFFNVVMGTIGSFQYFTQAFILTHGGPENSTMFYSLYLFDRAWRYLDMGYASAMAWVLFLFVIGVTAALFRTQRRWVHYAG